VPEAGREFGASKRQAFYTSSALSDFPRGSRHAGKITCPGYATRGASRLLPAGQVLSSWLFGLRAIHFTTERGSAKYDGFANWLRFPSPRLLTRRRRDVGYATPDAVTIATVPLRRRGSRARCLLVPRTCGAKPLPDDGKGVREPSARHPGRGEIRRPGSLSRAPLSRTNATSVRRLASGSDVPVVTYARDSRQPSPAKPLHSLQTTSPAQQWVSSNTPTALKGDRVLSAHPLQENSAGHALRSQS